MNKKILALSLSVICVLTLISGVYFTKNTHNKTANDSVSASTTEAPDTSDVSVTKAITVTTTIAESKETTVAPVSATKTSSDTKITPEKAKSIALKAAGFEAPEVWDKEAELDYEKGLLVYEVSFEKDNIDYEYIINAQSGEIIHSEIDPY